MLGARTSSPHPSDGCYTRIETTRRFSRFALSADRTSAFPESICGKAHRRELERALTLASYRVIQTRDSSSSVRNLLLQVIRRNLALHAQSYSRATSFGEAMNIT